MRFNKGQTLVEVIFVASTAGIALMFFFAFFLMAWMNFDMDLTRLHLQKQLDNALDVLEEDVMEGRSISVQNNNADMAITFPDTSAITYQIRNNGDFVRIVPGIGDAIIIPGFVNAGSSQFLMVNNACVCELTLNSDAFGRPITLSGRRTISRRN